MSLMMVNVYPVHNTVVEANVETEVSVLVVRRDGQELNAPLNVAGDATLLVNNLDVQSVNQVILENFAKSYVS